MATGEEILKPLLPFSSVCFGHSRHWGMPKEFDEPPCKKTCVGLESSRLIMDQKLLVRAVSEGVCTGPSTPKHAEGAKVIPPPSSKLEALPLRLLEEICQSLTIADLCRLSQVNKYCDHIFSKDEFWVWKAQEKAIAKAVEEKSWKLNVMAAQCRLLYVRRLNESPVYLRGDLVVIDPFKIFFTGRGNEIRLQMLKDLVRPFLYDNNDCVVTYRGVPAVFITSTYWDSDTAFEVTRKGTSIGVDVAMSKIIAAIPQELVDILREENGTDFQGGVSVEGVNGEFRSSRDGDFIIMDSTSGTSNWTDDEALERADVMCASGGSWTFSDDSSDEEDDMEMTEELARVLGETEDWL